MLTEIGERLFLRNYISAYPTTEKPDPGINFSLKVVFSTSLHACQLDQEQHAE